MSRIQSIHINFFLDEEGESQEFWYEQVHRFLREDGWKIDLSKPVLFLEPGDTGDASNIYDSPVLVKDEASLIEKIRKKEEVGEPLKLGFYTRGELSIIVHLEKGEFRDLTFWSLVQGQLVGQEVCAVFEQFTNKLVKPFCDNFRVQSVELFHG